MNNTDFTRGSITKSLLCFFFPMLLANILQQIYSFADMVIIGKGLGDHSVAAVGNFTTLSFFITGFIMGITNGFSVNISHAYGKKDFITLRRLVASSIKLSAISAALFTLAGILLLHPVLLLIKTDRVIMSDCLSYGYIIFGGLVITVSYNLISSILRAVGDSRTPLLAIGVSSVINITLDLLFIFLFGSGVFGPAYATVFSQLISVVICYCRLRKMKELRLKKCDFHSDWKSGIELLKNGVPMALMNSITSVGCIFVQGCINDYSVVYTSAYSVCSKYLNFFMLPGITAGFAVSAFSGQNYGAKKFERIRGGIKTAVFIALFSALTLGIILYFFSTQLAGLMLTGQEALACASAFLKFLALFIVLLNLLFVFRSCIQGLGKPAIPMCSGIVEMLIRIPVIFFGLPVFGFTATVYAEGMAWTGALALNIISYIYFLKQTEHGA